LNTLAFFPEDREKDQSIVFGSPEWRKAYNQYIKSSAWKKLCKQVRQRARNICERCRCFATRLEVHHLTYERFQNELLDDLQGLCPSCHAIADQEREMENRRKFEAAGEEARYENAKDTYMTKKYGPDWSMDCHLCDSQEFDDWLDRKEQKEWC
jgi:phage terminase large subunit GpA-like protein